MNEQSPKELQVTVPEKLRGGVYANVTNVGVTGNEVIFNFIFANPTDTPNGTLVGRVIISRKHATEVADMLRDSISTANEVDPQ